MIRYIISPNTNQHIFTVELSFTAKKSNYELKLPTWIPGSYMIREFSKNISQVRLINNDDVAILDQIDKNTWVIKNLIVDSLVRVIYEVYAYDFGIRTAYLDQYRGYFNATSLCLYIVGNKKFPHAIILNGIPDTWQVATGLKQLANCTYHAANYEELIDCPFEMGRLQLLDFRVRDIPHKIVLSGNVPHNFAKERLTRDVAAICAIQMELFDADVPFSEYTFLLHIGGDIYTGLEHRNSTALLAPYYGLPLQYHDTQEMNDDYLKLLGLISHEYFHLWNVKRIKPEAFIPYNLEHENYTTLLWWFEGVTSYYDDLMLYRSGIINKKRYLSLVLENINNVYKYAGCAKQTLANSSLTSWVKYYRQDENSPNAIVSYYTKGALVAMCIDLLIRDNTNNVRGLDDVLRGLYNKWRTDGFGIRDKDFINLIVELAQCDIYADIFSFVNTTEMLPLVDILAKVGIRLHLQTGREYSELGKIIDNNQVIKPVKIDLGCKLVKDTIGYKVTNVYNGTLAERLGLSAYDIIIAVNNLKLTNVVVQLGQLQDGDLLRLSFFRRERLYNSEIIIHNINNCTVYYLEIEDNNLLSARWLGIKE